MRSYIWKTARLQSAARIRSCWRSADCIMRRFGRSMVHIWIRVYRKFYDEKKPADEEAGLESGKERIWRLIHIGMMSS